MLFCSIADAVSRRYLDVKIRKVLIFNTNKEFSKKIENLEKTACG
jgi:hypothetical protein